MGGYGLVVQMVCLFALAWGGCLVPRAEAAIASSSLDLDVRQWRYLDGVENAAQSEDYTYLTGNLNLQAQKRRFTYKLNVLAMDANVKNEFYMGAPEAYVQPQELSPGFNLTIGRQKRHWSHLDEEFNLGVWQPQLRWDYLQPVQEGLIGVFFDWSVSPNLQFTFFTSPLSLPDQGPNYTLKDGQFSSANRWFMPPQSRLAFGALGGSSPNGPLYFQIDRPSTESVIMNSSFALGVMYQPSSPFWIQANYAYKPVNQIHLGVECSACANIGGNQPLEVTAVIHADVLKHHVLTMESGFDRADDHGYVSLTGDFPNGSDFPSTYYESPLDSMIIAGASYEHYIYSWIRVPSWLKYSYVKMFDVHTKDKQGVFDSEQVQSSLDRYPFRELAAVEWRVLLHQGERSGWRVTGRYTYSVPEKGSWVTADLDWTVGSFNWNLGLDFLGSDTDPNSNNAGLFTRYRANDRIYTGVGYVF